MQKNWTFKQGLLKTHITTHVEYNIVLHYICRKRFYRSLHTEIMLIGGIYDKYKC